MSILHIKISIEGLLNRDTEFLGDLFETDGKAARLELLSLQAKGDKYIGSDNCKNFDPMKGCCCGEQENNKNNNIEIIRTSGPKELK